MENKSYNNMEKRLNCERELEENIERLEEISSKKFLHDPFIPYRIKEISEGDNKEYKKYFIEKINYMKEKEMVFDIAKFSVEKRLLEEGKQAIEEIIEKYERKGEEFYCIAGYYASTPIVVYSEFINIHPDKEKLIQYSIEMLERAIKDMKEGKFYFLAESVANLGIEFSRNIGLKNKIKKFRDKKKKYMEKRVNLIDFLDEEIECPKFIYQKAIKEGLGKKSILYLMDGLSHKIESKLDCEILKEDIDFLAFSYKNQIIFERAYMPRYNPNDSIRKIMKKQKDCKIILDNLKLQK
ncbi:hypothetical protein JW949_00470 [Candidatus Woesearchaeota archaeon]|nr:hypothetical protein [Candidatus Woesearchaeota archaeon]